MRLELGALDCELQIGYAVEERHELTLRIGPPVVRRITIAARAREWVEIRWRDVDAFRHVNNAVYLTYLEECRDEWLERTLGGGEGSWDYLVARVAIDFRRGLCLEDDTVVVRCGLERLGTSSVTTREEIRTNDGELAAEAEAVVVLRDPDTGLGRRLRPEERSALERAA